MNWLTRYADYDRHMKQVEEAAKKNPYPFKAWFDASGRAFFPLYPDEAAVTLQPLAREDLRVMRYLAANGYTVSEEDYRAGVTKGKGKNKVRIGKILSHTVSLERDKINEELKSIGGSKLTGDVDADAKRTDLMDELEYLKDIEASYVGSSARKGSGKSPYVVISQRPHDVASMSTDRGWTSCMNLDAGLHKDDVYCEVSAGSLVAYLIEKDDVNILHPKARIHIKRFVNNEGGSIAVPEDAVYGDLSSRDQQSFKQSVTQWVADRQKTAKSGAYRRVGGKWTDSLGNVHIVINSVEEAWNYVRNPEKRWRVEVNPDLFDDMRGDFDDVTYATEEEARIEAENAFDIDDSWRSNYNEWEEIEAYEIVPVVDYEVSRKAIEYLTYHLDQLNDEEVRELYKHVKKHHLVSIPVEKRLGIVRNRLVEQQEDDERYREMAKSFSSIPDGPKKEEARRGLAAAADKIISDPVARTTKVTLSPQNAYINNLGVLSDVLTAAYDQEHPLPPELSRRLMNLAKQAPEMVEKHGIGNAEYTVRRTHSEVAHVFFRTSEHHPEVVSWMREFASEMMKQDVVEYEIYNTSETYSVLGYAEKIPQGKAVFLPMIGKRMAEIAEAYKSLVRDSEHKQKSQIDTVRKLYQQYKTTFDRLSAKSG